MGRLLIIINDTRSSGLSTDLSSKGVFTLPPILFYLEHQIWLFMRHSGHSIEWGNLAKSAEDRTFVSVDL